MTIYYKIPCASETGRKFSDLFEKKREVKSKIEALREKYGFGDTWRNGWVAAGLYAVHFPSEVEVDAKLWRDGGCGYRSFAPRMSSKAGKALKAEFEACGKVDRDEFNRVMNMRRLGCNIGVATANEFYLVSIGHDWSDNIPADAVEITGSEYAALTPKEEE